MNNKCGHIWSDYIGEVSNNQRKNCLTPRLVAGLNTIYHLSKESALLDARGCVRLIDKSRSDVSEYFLNKFQISIENWVNDKMFGNHHTFNSSAYQVVAVEISAACDSANDKPRTHRYLLGVICDDGNVKEIQGMKEYTPNSFYELPFPFIYDNESKRMYLHLNYSFAEESADLFGVLGDCIFRLKTEVMNQICQSYANQVTRLGIDCFK